MPVYWLNQAELLFPNPELANPEGVLAVGGDLRPARLLLAYQNGIFPWYNAAEPILWWSPNPRFVLFPEELKVHKSMRPYFNKQKYRVSFDTDFAAIIDGCQQTIRMGQHGTWITVEMREAYLELHRLGYAHSVEVWKQDQLVGGLYGIALGRVFFGESMFTRASNASKFGFITLVRTLQKRGYRLIDCQQETKHLASLGAESIKRRHFLDLLAAIQNEPTDQGSWQSWSPYYPTTNK